MNRGTRQIAQGLIEQPIALRIERSKVVNGLRGALQTKGKHVEIDRPEGGIAIIGHHPIGRKKMQQARSHAPKTQRRGTMSKITAAHLVHHQPACDVIWTEIHRVALHQVVGFDGGQHGINPAKRAAPLVFHRRCFEQHIKDKRRFFGLLLHRSCARTEPQKPHCEAKKNFLHAQQSYKENQ